MSGVYGEDEKWERRKTYLFRSLFEDQPLSVILEEREDSSTRAEDTQALEEHEVPSRSPNDPLDREFSPLPELIIEVEKKPIYDESDEFYKNLEIVMKGLVKKYLFRNEPGKADVDDCSEAEFDEETEILAKTTDMSREDTSSSSVVRSPQMVRRRQSYSNDITVSDIPLKKVKYSESLATPSREGTHDMEPSDLAFNMHSDEERSSFTSVSGDVEHAVALTSTSKSELSVRTEEREDSSTRVENIPALEDPEKPSRSPNEPLDRSSSPLPELIVNVEKTPTYDESDEYYKNLKTVMKSIVKKYLSKNEPDKADEAYGDGSQTELQEVETEELAITTDVSQEDTPTSSIVTSPQIVRRRSHSNDTVSDIPFKKLKYSESPATPSREVTNDTEPDGSTSNEQSDEEGSSVTAQSGDTENALATTSTSISGRYR